MATTADPDITQSPTPQAPAEEPAPAGGSRRRPIILLIVGIIALALLGWGFTKWRYARSHETTENAQVDGHIVPVISKVGGYVTRVTVAENDSARTSAEAADAAVTSLQSQASAAGASVSNARAGVRLAQAHEQGARAARENAALQLSYTHVTAPESGVVARKNVEVGQLVQPGQPLMAIVADSGVWVTANFKETQLAEMRVGQPVELEIDAYPGCVGEGRIESISSATGARFALLPPDNATGNFTKVVQRVPVRIAVEQGCGDARPLRPGMSVNAKVLTR